MKKFSNRLLYAIIYVSVIITCAILLFITSYIFIQGHSTISVDFILNDSKSQSHYLATTPEQITTFKVAEAENGTYIIQENVEKPMKNSTNEDIYLKDKDVILKIDGQDVSKIDSVAYLATLSPSDDVIIGIEKVGGGILPMIVATLYSILIALMIALPLGLATAIYLVEFTNKKSRLNDYVHRAIDNLAGIPSIIYGLFGMLFFVNILGFGYSLIAGGLTLSIMLMPIIIRTTEEALKSVPDNLREASYGLGATKIQTIFSVVLPSAVNGIVVAVILSIGRVIGESAILLFTAGTVAKMPSSIFDSSATLTVQAYLLTKESGDIAQASAIGIVIITIIIILNIITKLVARRFTYKA